MSFFCWTILFEISFFGNGIQITEEAFQRRSYEKVFLKNTASLQEVEV